MDKLILRIKNREGYIIPILLVLMIFSVFSFFYIKSHHVDILSFCHISVDKHFLRGNSETVIKAINKIKAEDKAAYKDVCKYVTLISENLCPIDHTYAGPWSYNNQPGCYLKGSRIIYINPNKEDTDNIIEERAQAIKKYANFSKAYWK